MERSKKKMEDFQSEWNSPAAEFGPGIPGIYQGCCAGLLLHHRQDGGAEGQPQRDGSVLVDLIGELNPVLSRITPWLM
eukprot:scaffold232856_cov52-Prasinocladus_malaysianus.AAC.1